MSIFNVNINDGDTTSVNLPQVNITSRSELYQLYLDSLSRYKTAKEIEEYHKKSAKESMAKRYISDKPEMNEIDIFDLDEFIKYMSWIEKDYEFNSRSSGKFLLGSGISPDKQEGERNEDADMAYKLFDFELNNYGINREGGYFDRVKEAWENNIISKKVMLPEKLIGIDYGDARYGLYPVYKKPTEPQYTAPINEMREKNIVLSNNIPEEKINLQESKVDNTKSKTRYLRSHNEKGWGLWEVSLSPSGVPLEKRWISMNDEEYQKILRGGKNVRLNTVGETIENYFK